MRDDRLCFAPYGQERGYMHTEVHNTCNNGMIAVTVGDKFSPASLLTPLEAEFLRLQLTNAIREACAVPTYHPHQIESYENEGGLYA